MKVVPKLNNTRVMSIVTQLSKNQKTWGLFDKLLENPFRFSNTKNSSQILFSLVALTTNALFKTQENSKNILTLYFFKDTDYPCTIFFRYRGWQLITCMKNKQLIFVWEKKNSLGWCCGCLMVGRVLRMLGF